MDKRGKMLLLMTTLITASSWLTGCSPVEKTLNLLIGGGEQQKSTTQEQNGVVKIVPVERPGTAGTTGKPGSGGTSGPQASPQGSPISPPVVKPEKIQITLYYAAKDGSQLVQENRKIDKVPGMARKTVEELLKGPGATSGLANTIPTGTQLLDINLKPDGLAIANFSGELKNSHSGGSSSEAMTVYSIVNTLAQFPTVQRVQILLEGETIETLAGHLDIAKPLEPDYSLIKQNLP